MLPGPEDSYPLFIVILYFKDALYCWGLTLTSSASSLKRLLDFFKRVRSTQLQLPLP